MLKWATWSILVKIFHKASAIPSQPSKNTVEWFQTRWNQEKTNAQTPPKPVELLLSLHKELQGPGKGRALKELQAVLSPPQNCAWQRSNATQVLSQTSSGWCLPRLAWPLLKRAAPVLSSIAAPWSWDTPQGWRRRNITALIFTYGKPGTNARQVSKAISSLFCLCLKSFKNNFLRVIFVRGYRGSLWKSQRPGAVYKANILTV